jgi:hypothetical protein
MRSILIKVSNMGRSHHHYHSHYHGSHHRGRPMPMGSVGWYVQLVMLAVMGFIFGGMFLSINAFSPVGCLFLGGVLGIVLGVVLIVIVVVMYSRMGIVSAPQVPPGAYYPQPGQPYQMPGQPGYTPPQQPYYQQPQQPYYPPPQAPPYQPPPAPPNPPQY